MNDLRPSYDYDAYVEASHAAWDRPPQARYSTFDIVVMCICGVVGGCSLMGLLCGGFLVLSSVLSTSPTADPHGYGIIFGTVLAVPSALVTAIVLPGAFPPGLRAKAFGASAVIFALLAGLTYLLIQVS